MRKGSWSLLNIDMFLNRPIRRYRSCCSSSIAVLVKGHEVCMPEIFTSCEAQSNAFHMIQLSVKRKLLSGLDMTLNCFP